jgi:hypothetical protein
VNVIVYEINVAEYRTELSNDKTLPYIRAPRADVIDDTAACRAATTKPRVAVFVVSDVLEDNVATSNVIQASNEWIVITNNPTFQRTRNHQHHERQSTSVASDASCIHRKTWALPMAEVVCDHVDDLPTDFFEQCRVVFVDRDEHHKPVW